MLADAKILIDVGAVGLELAHLLADLVRRAAALVELTDRRAGCAGPGSTPRAIASRSSTSLACPGLWIVVKPAISVDVGVLGAVKNLLRRRARARRVAAVLVEMPADVRVDVDHPGHDRQLSQVVSRVGRRCRSRST